MRRPRSLVDPYRCGFYRLELSVPPCSANAQNQCPFNESFATGSNEQVAEIILNLTNPPGTVFPVGDFGPEPKGNPRILNAPNSQFQFTIDGTQWIVDWPGGDYPWPNDYTPVQRPPEFSTTGICSELEQPGDGSASANSTIKIIVKVTDTRDPQTGKCVATR